MSGANGWRALVLPAVPLALPTEGILSQEVMRESYRSRAGEAVRHHYPRARRVRTRAACASVLRHALLPVVLAAFVHVVISTLLDIAYLFIDPRLRSQ